MEKVRRGSNLPVNLRKVKILVCLFSLRRAAHVYNPRKLKIARSKASWGAGAAHCPQKRRKSVSISCIKKKKKGGKVLDNVVIRLLSFLYCVTLDQILNLSRHEFPLL